MVNNRVRVAKGTLLRVVQVPEFSTPLAGMFIDPLEKMKGSVILLHCHCRR